MCQYNIQLTHVPLQPNEAFQWAHTANCGAVNMFIGSVRNSTQGRTVTQLQFEAYTEMALLEMQKIAEAAAQKWDLKKVWIHHRIGVLTVMELPVVIAVASAGRAASFQACQYIIDTLKQTVPIWKKELFTDGEEWVSAHP